MPRIVSNGTFNVYVYAKDHPPPHCHVFWGGDKESAVSLTALGVIAGDPLPRPAVDLIRAHLQESIAAWQRLNP